MQSSYFSIQVGDIRCTALSDGVAVYPVEFVFPDLDPAERAEKAGEPGPEIRVPYTCLLVEVGERRVLLDTGLGAGVQPTAGLLMESLAAAQIPAESIDTVVITHGHPDHVGGLTNDAGELLFPNANYVMTEADWKFWTANDLDQQLRHLPDPIIEMLTGLARKNLPAIAERVELVGNGYEIANGLRLISAPGHTLGHAALEIASRSECLLAIADAVVLPIQLQYPDWCVVPDMDRDQTVATRRRLLDRAAADRSLVLPSHFPFPCAGRVTVNGSVWDWEPMEGA